MAGKADSMTYGPTNFTEYLAALRAKASILAGDSVTDDSVLATVKDEYIKQHEMAVAWQYLGDDGAGDPVWRLGTIIVLKDLSSNLAANVASGALKKVPGAETAYSCNPAIGPH